MQWFMQDKKKTNVILAWSIKMSEMWSVNGKMFFKRFSSGEIVQFARSYAFTTQKLAVISQLLIVVHWTYIRLYVNQN